MALNSVMIHGRLTKDPESRATSSGKQTASFTVAVGTGETASFIPCVAWEKTATNICAYFNKGSEIIVSGYLKSRRYTDKDGKNHSVLEVIVNAFDFCGSRGEQAVSKPAMPEPDVAPPDWSFLGGNDDELPF